MSNEEVEQERDAEVETLKRMIKVLQQANAEQHLIGKVMVNVITFAAGCDESVAFLRTWIEGDFETIKREWPEFKFEEVPSEQG